MMWTIICISMWPIVTLSDSYCNLTIYPSTICALTLLVFATVFHRSICNGVTCLRCLTMQTPLTVYQRGHYCLNHPASVVTVEFKAYLPYTWPGVGS